ncbi:formate dehydrogenase accessory sulfurtransferase FdhD [Quadrisphaera sp. INWT6]|uniref:formate dehydrogenase accessory sulfurtransferase FdhD n=1 Tax=Quadrisphaera sp. INWT6 TaxID=2596917 RepID=UPI0018922DC8|nr:formate dehydrogenase accessory sulfurtransferase FdhD [Quadrisphaera sp. INWT6]MBF5082321.1 formate dehydrogenase accessory sulfurtransferase FdhD [Quadrisphaera sp. INWT6]
MRRSSPRSPVLRLDTATGAAVRRPDSLAAEEPLEVRVRALSEPEASPVVVTMRTPGEDVDLALGFLLTEGLLGSADDVAAVVHCGDPDPADPDGLSSMNVLQVTLAPGVPAPDLEGRRTFGMTSACGVCGSASIDAVSRRSRYDLSADDVVVDAAVLTSLPDRLRSAQRIFDRTGGLHAAGLFTADGELLAVAEDVGRHNAVDKVLGRAARERLGGGWPLRGAVLQVSGRASFELAQKAWCAGVPVLSAVSAPSSLAVELARTAGMTLAGFVRAPRLNVYAGEHRVRLAAPSGDRTAASPAVPSPAGRG